MAETFTVWITQYALTVGIERRQAEASGTAETMVCVFQPGWTVRRYVHAPYWHLSLEAAVAHAEQMRKKKIASLEKSLARLRTLKFGTPTGRPEGPSVPKD
jgi:hypothetical protein